MDIVFLASNRPGLGKTAMAAGLALQWQSQGRATAYMRVGTEGEGQEADTAYLSSLTPSPQGPGSAQLPQPPRLNPDTQTMGDMEDALRGFASQAARLGQKVVVEVAPPQGEEARTWALCGELAEAANGAVVALVDFDALIEIDHLDLGLRPVRQQLHGILVNASPPYRMREATAWLNARARAGAVRTLGMVPEDRMMLAPTVADLAEHLGAEWAFDQEEASVPEKTGALVCRVLIGGNLMDPGVTYFGRHRDQAVVVRGDRPDIQLAALGSRLACLVLTGGHHPIPYVQNEAQEQQVPVLVVDGDTPDTVQAVAGLLSLGAVYHRRKAQRYAHLLQQHCEAALLETLLA